MKFAVLTNSSGLFELICQCLHDEFIECHRFDDEASFVRAFYRDEYRAILVDAASGDESTRAVSARRACYDNQRAPLIVLGTFADRASIERAFRAGADEVVLWPLDRAELVVRIHQALGRVPRARATRTDPSLRFGTYRLDPRVTSVTLNDRRVSLSANEFAIVWLLFSQAGQYVSRRELAQAVWGSTEELIGRTLEQHIYKLRRKLQLNGTWGVNLRTRYAHGYRVELCTHECGSPDLASPAEALACVQARGA